MVKVKCQRRKLTNPYMKQDKQFDQICCAVTGVPLRKEEAIKLLMSPQQLVVADLYDALPGEAKRVAFTAEAMQQVTSQEGVKALFGENAVLMDGFLNHVYQNLHKQVLQSLSLSKKAGVLIVGGQKAKVALNDGRVKLIFQSKGGSERELKKLIQGEYKHIDVCDLFESHELAGILGQNHIGYLALLKGKLADKIYSRCLMLENWLKTQ